MTEYVFENASEQAPSRFTSLESTYAPTSRAHIGARGSRPGGWLVVEDFFAGVDELLYGDTEDGELALYLGVRRALSAFIALSGVDDRYSRRLPDLLSGAGLQEVAADGHLVFASGRSAAS